MKFSGSTTPTNADPKNQHQQYTRPKRQIRLDLTWAFFISMSFELLFFWGGTWTFANWSSSSPMLFVLCLPKSSNFFLRWGSRFGSCQREIHAFRPRGRNGWCCRGIFVSVTGCATPPKKNTNVVAVGVVVVVAVGVVVVVVILRILEVLLKYPTFFLRVASATNLTATDNTCLWQGSWGVYTWSWDTHVGTEILRSSSN